MHKVWARGRTRRRAVALPALRVALCRPSGRATALPGMPRQLVGSDQHTVTSDATWAARDARDAAPTCRPSTGRRVETGGRRATPSPTVSSSQGARLADPTRGVGDLLPRRASARRRSGAPLRLPQRSAALGRRAQARVFALPPARGDHRRMGRRGRGTRPSHGRLAELASPTPGPRCRHGIGTNRSARLETSPEAAAPLVACVSGSDDRTG
jgi:hypothetical protein